MWDLLSAVAIGLGTVLVWKGYTNRDNQTEPPGVAEGTPVRDWPKSISPAESTDHQFARHWQASLAVGVALLLVGLVGTFVDSYRLYANPTPSRDDVIDTISKDPTNTMDRDELNCMLDFFEGYGIDITSSDEDQLLADLGAATANMNEAELDRLDGCFDAETLAQNNEAVSGMSDEQLRVFFVEALIADPIDPLDRPSAECMVDLIEERGVLRELAESDGAVSRSLDSILLEAEAVCL